MTIRYHPDLVDKLKKLNVRVRKSFKVRMIVFSKNPKSSELNNHYLKEKWTGYRSIDITGEWRAIYIEKREDKEMIAYFVDIGTHGDLYGK